MRWNIEARVSGLNKPLEYIYNVVSDPAKAAIIPGVKRAKLVCGEDRSIGAKYLCDVEVGRVGAQMEIEVIEVKPPYRTAAKVNRICLPVDGRVIDAEGKGEWVIQEEVEGNSLTLKTQGKAGGIGSIILGLIGFDEKFMIEKTKEALRNIKRELNGMV